MNNSYDKYLQERINSDEDIVYGAFEDFINSNEFEDETLEIDPQRLGNMVTNIMSHIKMALDDTIEFEEGFINNKSKEETLAKSMIRILRDKSNDMGIDPKKVLDYMLTKMRVF